MSTSLSNLVDSLSDGVYDNKCKGRSSTLDFMKFEDNKLTFRCLECKWNYNKDFNAELIERFSNIYEFYNKDINIFMLLLNRLF